jgi:formyltetrahydrofolate deformylase
MTQHHQSQRYVLNTSCPDTIGIARAVMNFIYDLGGGIVDTSQFVDVYNDHYFMRTDFNGVMRELPDLATIQDMFAPIAAEFGMTYQFHDVHRPPRVLIAVSKHGHCLNDLLFRWEAGELNADIAGVVSNHEDMRAKVEWHGLPYHYLPVTPDTKAEQEAAVLHLIEEQNVELLVLARYMQILSPGLCKVLRGRAINIHHSFLPGFKGARPYHQAYERGVKVIGATAHYVTEDLDDGPIIEQDTQRVEHYHSPEDLVRTGRDIENIVLARAVNWHCTRRVMLNGNRTVVFK